MIIAGAFVAGAVAAWWFFGWRAGVEALSGYLWCLVGANSPQTFKRSKAGLERIANAALAKAKTLTQRGK